MQHSSIFVTKAQFKSKTEIFLGSQLVGVQSTAGEGQIGHTTAAVSVKKFLFLK